MTEVMQGLNMHKITGALSVLRVLCKRFEYNSAAPLSPAPSTPKIPIPIPFHT